MAKPAAHTEVPAGKNSFPPFQVEHFPSQLLWLVLTFILLYVLMSRIALPRIGSILDDRSRRIADDLTAAHDLRKRSEAAGAAYEKALADARTRAQGIASETRDQQAAAVEEANKRLEAQLHDRIAGAEKSITATRATAMGNVASIAASTATAIVERLIGAAPNEHEVAAAVGDAMKN